MLLDKLSEKLADLGKKHRNMVLFNADFSRLTGTEDFAELFGERYFNMGMAEENTICAAAGFAVRGKIPVVAGIASFITGRAFEQIRNSICYPNLGVKIIGVGSGFSFSKDGHLWQCYDDVALMRSLPNMKIVAPSCVAEMQSALDTMMNEFGPVYMRLPFEFEESAVLSVDLERQGDFRFGKSSLLREGSDLMILATSVMVGRALGIADVLASEGLSCGVVNMSSVKPLDEKLLREVAGKGMKIVILENHNVIGGLGSAVAEVLACGKVADICMIGVEDRFGESGKEDDLLSRFNLDSKSILQKIRDAIRLG